jgi:hypothetical protein
VRCFDQTCTGNTRLVFVVNENDPTKDAYGEVFHALSYGRPQWVEVCYADASNMVEALNLAAVNIAISGMGWGRPAPFAVGFMGDDHRPRTKGWDSRYVTALREMGTGIVYGDDLLQHEALPTQCAMTSDIIQALGYMAPPQLTHLYVDNFWLALGRAAGCIQYLQDVVVEHLHPIAAKAEWDEGHLRVNAQEMHEKDNAAYRNWLYEGYNQAVDAVRSLAGEKHE